MSFLICSSGHRALSERNKTLPIVTDGPCESSDAFTRTQSGHRTLPIVTDDTHGPCESSNAFTRTQSLFVGSENKVFVWNGATHVTFLPSFQFAPYSTVFSPQDVRKSPSAEKKEAFYCTTICGSDSQREPVQIEKRRTGLTVRRTHSSFAKWLQLRRTRS